MSDITRQNFKLHLPGLLRVLAEHLYSNKQVALRELVQNAHDSCLRRAVQMPDEHYRPSVVLRIAHDRRTLIVEDNGSGLTRQEIDDYLATIGRSYTRELRQNLDKILINQATEEASPDDWRHEKQEPSVGPNEASQLIGQFGFGFLSAFLLASQVTLVTRSWQSERSDKPGNEALCWRSTGDESYEVSPAERAEIGTTIELELKPSAVFALNPQLLVQSIQQYADFLPIPIYVGDDPAPINMQRPPWAMPNPEEATRRYIERVFHEKDPLWVMPLTDYTVDLGHDRMEVPLRGFLFIPAGSVASVREYGDLMVYIRNMFIRAQEKDLLPPWARFVRGVIDCPNLQPTASREDVHQDEMFEFVKQAIEEQLSEGLRRVARHSPAVWRQIVQGHTDVIMGWAVRDENFFTQVEDIVTLPTSRGPMSLPDYIALTGGECFYVTRQLGSLQEQLLAEGYGVPVIDASWFAITPFLQKYAAHHPRVQLTRLDGDAASLMRPTDDSRYVALLDYFDRRGIQARVAAFRPTSVPALMLYPEDAERLLEAHEAVANEEIPAPFLSLISDYVEEKRQRRSDLRGTLYLNASCGLLAQLADLPVGGARDAVLTLLYEVARLFAARTLNAQGATEAFAQATQALQQLLR